MGDPPPRSRDDAGGSPRDDDRPYRRPSPERHGRADDERGPPPPSGDAEASETMPLSDQDVAYLVGKSGQTRMRLENFSGARLQIGKGVAEVTGTDEERDRAKLAIDITLQQRNGRHISYDFHALERRHDVEVLDVPKDVVGFLLGAKGQSLRALESKFRTFMFFDNEHVRADGGRAETKRLYILGGRRGREDALAEAQEMVAYKDGRGGRGPPPRREPPPPSGGGGGPRGGGDRHDRPGRYERGPPEHDRYERGRYDRDRYDRDRYDRERYYEPRDRYYERERDYPPRERGDLPPREREYGGGGGGGPPGREYPPARPAYERGYHNDHGPPPDGRGSYRG